MAHRRPQEGLVRYGVFWKPQRAAAGGQVLQRRQSPDAPEEGWEAAPVGQLQQPLALADEDPGEALFRYGSADGAERTARFGLEGLAALLPRLEKACAPRY